MASDVRDFPSLNELLTDIATCKRTLQLNLSALSRRLGYRSHRTLGMVLSGERKPSHQLATKICKHLGLSGIERKYVELLVEADRAVDCAARSRVSQELESIRSAQFHYLEDDVWEKVCSWPHYVIRQLIATKNFSENPREIAKKLDNKITALEAGDIIANLLRHGLIARNAAGKLVNTQKSIASVSHQPNKANRLHHREMVGLAKEAISSQSMEKRSLRSLTLAFERTRMDEARAAILAFVTKFNAEFSADGKASDVYQLNVQFFSHTK